MEWFPTADWSVARCVSRATLVVAHSREGNQCVCSSSVDEFSYRYSRSTRAPMFSGMVPESSLSPIPLQYQCNRGFLVQCYDESVELVACTQSQVFATIQLPLGSFQRAGYHSILWRTTKMKLLSVLVRRPPSMKLIQGS